MRIVHTELQAYEHTRNPDSLELLRSAQGVRENLKAQESLILLDTGDWILSGKAAPYSDKDCMIIYGGENQEVRSLSDCTRSERKNLEILLKRVV